MPCQAMLCGSHAVSDCIVSQPCRSVPYRTEPCHAMPCSMSCHVMSYNVLSYHVLSCHVMLYQTIPCHPYHSTPYYTMLYVHDTTPYRTMPCMPFHAIPWQPMPYHASPCRTIPSHPIPSLAPLEPHPRFWEQRTWSWSHTWYLVFFCRNWSKSANFPPPPPFLPPALSRPATPPLSRLAPYPPPPSCFTVIHLHVNATPSFPSRPAHPPLVALGRVAVQSIVAKDPSAEVTSDWDIRRKFLESVSRSIRLPPLPPPPPCWRVPLLPKALRFSVGLGF